MKVTDYMKTVETAGGFPQGDTFLDLETIDLEDTEFIDAQGHKLRRTKIISGHGQEYFAPISVVRELGKLAIKGKKRVRVTRVGKLKEDTKYTVIAV